MIRAAFPKTEDQNKALGAWLKERLPDANYEQYRTIAFINDEAIVGVVLYHNYRDTDCEIVFAGEGQWASRGAINTAISYPFSIGCNRITALVRKDNKPARKLVQRLGFLEEGKIRRVTHDGRDMFVYGLLPEEYRLKKIRE